MYYCKTLVMDIVTVTLCTVEITQYLCLCFCCYNWRPAGLVEECAHQICEVDCFKWGWGQRFDGP